MIDEFLNETTPVYKCPSCRWYFAPAENVVLGVLRTGLEERNGKGAEKMEAVVA